MSHTPGPWHVIPHPEWTGGMSRIAREADEPWGNFGEIAYAAPNDAHLIAAAPDLLAVVTRLLGDDWRRMFSRHVLEAMTAAVAKAAGS